LKRGIEGRVFVLRRICGLDTKADSSLRSE
jgi:hypothetical protein